MRKLFFGLAALIIISTIALGVIWLDRANTAKKNVKEYLDSLNTEYRTISYESIETSGFPTSINVSIVKPHFVGRIDQIAKNSLIGNMLSLTTLPEWSEDYTLDGNIEFGVNSSANKFKLIVRGDWSGKGTIAGKSFTHEGQSNGDSVCELQINNNNAPFANLWNINLLNATKSEFIKNFRSFECTNLGGRFIDAETKETTYNYGNSRIYFSRSPSDDLSDIHLYMKLQDFEATKAYDVIYNTYSQSITPQKITLPPSLYGKQNFEIDVSFNGTEDWTKPEAKTKPLDIKINKFSFSNAAYQSSVALKLSNKLGDNTQDIVFSFKAENAANKLLGEILKQELHTIAEGIKSKFGNLPPEELDKMLLSIIPDFNYLGKTIIALDTNYKRDNNAVSTQIDVGSFELSAAPYGITAESHLTRQKDKPIPSGEVSISCNNCLQMIDDVMSYVDRVEKVLSALSIDKYKLGISPETIETTKKILVALQKPDSTDKKLIKLHIVSDGIGSVTVNDKNSEEINALFTQFSAPSLQKPIPQTPIPQKKEKTK